MTDTKPPPEVQTTPDPYANKAIAAAAVTIVTVLVQWLATEELQLDQEGITAIGGAVATVLVYVVSNWKRKGT